MCEVCHMSPCDCRCPNADPVPVGECANCGETLFAAYEYYGDNENNYFCAEECAKAFHGIRAVE